MARLSDTQLVILSAACQRDDRLVLPLPERLKGGAANKVIDSLAAKGFIAEVDARNGDPIWRKKRNGHGVTLVVTDAALIALGIEIDADPDANEMSGPAPDAVQIDDATASDPALATANAETGPSGAARRTRENTKQAKLIAMLRAPDGATIDEIVAALEWQSHTVRGAIAGALKKKLGLDVTSEKVEGRGRIYKLPPA
ncbi:DUF3489 domain-containing protein [Blastochloris viridis]|uniref:DUF3489 domain-containing protein n=1 Tax=Blastochloris viridis TaxID=1079 RepID=A0A0H5BIZ1_BLAVI|nr:DUF3489 domain-containing protein [Blastochloris viridis]ALK09016.1 hypothetical protein BVIR_1227 [Blastochloris viridis]BAS01125.1 hypothetical protein BV133_3531 [Blastochloris viridis]CUU41677.1 hypothetical protein BVIRIDIS_06700 [Blastochloris viridis]